MSEWPIEIDGHEYQPIPESWLDHPNSVRITDGSNRGAFAVSAAVWGMSLRLRYIHPSTNEIFRARTGAIEHENGLVPMALESGKGWPAQRSPSMAPVGVARQPEIEHFHELWHDRIMSVSEPEPTA